MSVRVKKSTLAKAVAIASTVGRCPVDRACNAGHLSPRKAFRLRLGEIDRLLDYFLCSMLVVSIPAV
jgi:hypothetical protein